MKRAMSVFALVPGIAGILIAAFAALSSDPPVAVGALAVGVLSLVASKSLGG